MSPTLGTHSRCSVNSSELTSFPPEVQLCRSCPGSLTHGASHPLSPPEPVPPPVVPCKDNLPVLLPLPREFPLPDAPFPARSWVSVNLGPTGIHTQGCPDAYTHTCRNTHAHIRAEKQKWASELSHMRIQHANNCLNRYSSNDHTHPITRHPQPWLRACWVFMCRVGSSYGRHIPDGSRTWD